MEGNRVKRGHPDALTMPGLEAADAIIETDEEMARRLQAEEDSLFVETSHKLQDKPTSISTTSFLPGQKKESSVFGSSNKSNIGSMSRGSLLGQCPLCRRHFHTSLLGSHAAECQGHPEPNSKKMKSMPCEDTTVSASPSDEAALTSGVGVPYSEWHGGEHQSISDPSMPPPHVRRGLTMKGGLTSAAILTGVKIIENRSWKLPTGEWLALHTGATESGPQTVYKYRELWGDSMPPETSLPKGIVGAVRIAQHRTLAECEAA